jgi:hypothetical protein
VYKEHPAFDPPGDGQQRVWRYMDFTKFVSLLDTGSLFFSRADQLGDPFEGSYPRLNVENRPHLLGMMIDPSILTNTLTMMHDTLRSLPMHTFVNCWHMSGHESSAMWKLYAQAGGGVAIQSTFSLLCDAFAEAEQEVHVGTVGYTDYEREWIPEHNTFHAFLHKRKSFEHEKELRVIHAPFDSKDVCQYGVYIPVRVSTLVESVCVAPFAPEWFGDLVRSVAKKYSAKLRVVKSALDADPMY